VTGSTPAVGTGLPRGAGDELPQQVPTPEVPLYDSHDHAEGTIPRERAEAGAVAGTLRVVRSRGVIVRVYRVPAPREDSFAWFLGRSDHFTTWKARRGGGRP
jgi:hypothetical protein